MSSRGPLGKVREHGAKTASWSIGGPSLVGVIPYPSNSEADALSSRGPLDARSAATSDRIRQTVALLGRRGYALSPERLAELCLGGPISPEEVLWSVAASHDLILAGDLVVDRAASGSG